MKKLERKHIACYLPYELKLQLNPTSYNEYITEFNLNENNCKNQFLVTALFLYDGAEVEIDYERHCNLVDIKPIFHPISDLTKTMTHPSINDGKEFIPILEIVKLLWDKDWQIEIDDENPIFHKTPFYLHHNSQKIYVRYYNQQLLSYDEKGALAFHGLTVPMIELLNQLHFDYQGLIEQGLAIDINTIE